MKFYSAKKFALPTHWDLGQDISLVCFKAVLDQNYFEQKTNFSPKNIRLGLQMILGSDLGSSHLWARRMEALG